jgi:hypothetical protein
VSMQHPLAKTGEVGFAVAAERHELPVEHRPHRQLFKEVEVRRHVPAAPATNAERAFGRDDGPGTRPTSPRMPMLRESAIGLSGQAWVEEVRYRARPQSSNEA